ncbi:hypothetical protein [Streptomyces botrytidirepellens]|uniref:hypothetical protein n=1 Tax=Streptomyces botrytidirepellens TaxID=2486417 RepID=UPI001612FD42|nr:hypothetical protein [Streptomyces botrytidirepellens]
MSSRLYALTPWAPGRMVPAHSWSRQQAASVGVLLAELHCARRRHASHASAAAEYVFGCPRTTPFAGAEPFGERHAAFEAEARALLDAHAPVVP